MSGPVRVDRRTTIKWMLAASAALPAMSRGAFAAAAETAASVATSGYGSDPALGRTYRPGDVWPLTLTAAQRRTAAALCDLVVPEDDGSPRASAVGVVDFLDEWVSAPYPAQQQDRPVILAGLEWLDQESQRRFGRGFAGLDQPQQAAICDDICYLPKAEPRLARAAGFFARFRDLTVGAFYTTPAGMRDIRYVGNVALPRFDGPPPEVLRQLGLDEEPA